MRRKTQSQRPPKRPLELAVLVLVLVAGCGHEPAEQGSYVEGSYAFAELEGKLVSDEPFVVVPNLAWRRQEQEDVWYFGHSASLICHVSERPAQPVDFFFVPEGPGDHDFELRWNGDDVSERLRRHESGELRLEIPAAWLWAGTHFLSLRQPQAGAPAAGAPAAGERFQLFRALGYRYRGELHALPTADFHAYNYLARLFNFGLTGSFNRESLGGFVFSGPRTVEVDLGSARGGLLQTRVQNSGAGAAFFRVAWEGATEESRLASHERRHLRLEVPPGVRKVALSVEGDPNGYFLWGAPHFQPRSADRAVRPRTPIVLVTLDTTRRDALYAYGGELAATPHLSAFAAHATVFDRAYTTAPWTLPAHASIFTGLYPSKHGAGVAGDHLEIGFETVAERLRSRGYLTAGFAGGTLTSVRFGVGQGFAVFRNAEGFETVADRLTDHALDFLADTVVGRTATGGETLEGAYRVPFFLFVNYFDPHFPYRAPETFQRARGVPNRRRALAGDELWQEILDGSGQAWERAVDGHAPASAAALAALRAAYLAEVAFMDEQFGRLYRKLQDWDLFRDALIIVTSDHGELLGEGGYFSHTARLDGELVEIPLIVKWPGQREGRRDARLVSLVDLFPTILEAAGDPAAGDPAAGDPAAGPAVDGLALGPRSGGRELAERRFVIAEEHEADFHQLPPGMRIAADLFAVLGGSERHLSWDGGEACYRREADGWRGAACGAASRAARRLLRELTQGVYRPQVDRIGMSNEEREQLKALGYIR